MDAKPNLPKRSKNRTDPRKNAEGYMDLTHHDAVKHVTAEKKDEERFNKLLRTIFYICELAGFRIKNRIVLEDSKTGRVWK